MSYAATVGWWMEGRSQYTRQGFQTRAAAMGWNLDPKAMEHTMSGRVCAITGANAGLGFELASELCRRDATVHLLCRNKERGEKAIKAIKETTKGHGNAILHIVDVSDENSIKDFAARFSKTEDKLHCLVNNAGVVPERRQVTADGNEVSFATMAGGSFLLTSLLLPLLERSKPARVVNMSSAGMYTCKLDPSNIQCDQDKKYDGVFAYAHAKRAQVILTEMWQERCRGSGVTFHSTHPGWCDTPGVSGKSMEWFHKRMGDNLRSPSQGVDTAAWLCCDMDPRLDDSDNGGGEFWFDRQPARKHMRFAWTRESAQSRKQLWQSLTKMFNHIPGPGSKV